jgi:Domain of unknown function (DUF4383)
MLPRLLRYVSLAEIVVLIITGGGLFFFPGLIDDLWPWPLTPFNARSLGAVYLAALTSVTLMIVIDRWDPARTILGSILGFTSIVFIISLIEIDRFDFDRPGTWGWFLLYFILPVNSAYQLWRSRDEPTEMTMRFSPFWSVLLWGSAGLVGAYTAGMLIAPGTFTEFWPWPVDDFHGRMYSAAFISAAAGFYGVARHRRPIDMFAIGIVHVFAGVLPIVGLLVVNASRDVLDWSDGGLWLWLAVFSGLSSLGVAMVARSRREFSSIPLPLPGMDRRDVAAKAFALLFSAAFLSAGISGFLPPFLADLPDNARSIDLTASYGYLVGLYPVNALHTLIHLTLGIAGVLALIGRISIGGYARATAVILTAFTVMGLIPGLWTTFGVLPLYGHDVWLHAAEAAIAAYVGFVLLAPETAPPITSQPIIVS